MKARMDYIKRSPGVYQAMAGLAAYLTKCGLEKSLLHLVTTRVSQINSCVFCLNLHVEEALADGENSTRLYLLGVWRDTPLFSEREQAALAWAEAVTSITDGGVPDELYAHARQQFSEEELVNLTLAVVSINGWNRFSISFRIPPVLKSHKQEKKP